MLNEKFQQEQKKLIAAIQPLSISANSQTWFLKSLNYCASNYYFNEKIYMYR